MDTKEREIMDDIEIIDDFDDVVTPNEIKPEPVQEMNIFEGHQIAAEYDKEKELQKEVPVEATKTVDAMTQLQQELKSHLNESEVIEKPKTEEVLSRTQTDLKIDDELIHSSLENTMLLNKELLKAAAAETVAETKDEAKENKKGIVFVIIIFTCLIIFTALIPFILKMFGK